VSSGVFILDLEAKEGGQGEEGREARPTLTRPSSPSSSPQTRSRQVTPVRKHVHRRGRVAGEAPSSSSW
jgi:hypothetical protein